jgi:serine/threonine protein kinase
VVHRDIKKENILVVDGDVYVLADFGVSEEVFDFKNNYNQKTDCFEVIQNVSGTPLYMSPQLRVKNK